MLLAHGRNGAPDQAQIAEIAEAYLARDWRVAAPELPNSIALPNSGPPEEVTFTRHAQATAEVWAWLVRQWPDTPQALAGHSIGAFAIAQLAGAAPEAHHLLAVSPPISGLVLLSAREALGPAAIEAVQRDDGYLNTNFDNPGQEPRYSYFEWGHGAAVRRSFVNR